MDNHNSLTINGIKYSAIQLSQLCNQKIHDVEVDDWEKDIFKFIHKWISQSHSITVSTSGSSGSPKEIELQKSAMITSALATVKALNIVPNNTIWLCLPIHYIAGIMVVVRAFAENLNLVYSKPVSMPTLETKTKVDFVSMIPSQVTTLLETEKGKTQLEQIGKILIGGSGITPTLESMIIENKNIDAYHSYGMTETITHIALRRIGNKTSIGDFIPLSGVNISTNKENQLIITYPDIGVFNLKTVDIATIFDDGSFTILGRKDDIIISGGVKLHPTEIENKIKEIIACELSIGGIPDEKLGQKLVLYIEGKESDLTIESLREKLTHKLSKYQIPKEIIFVKEFKRTGSGKIIRNKMS